MFLTFQLGQAPVVREQFVRRLSVCFCEMALLRNLSGVLHIVSASIYGYSFQRELEEIKCLFLARAVLSKSVNKIPQSSTSRTLIS